MPNITAVGAVVSPILLPFSADGPVLLSITLTTESADPRASTALTVVRTVMEFEENVPRPECRDIQPWDLVRPILLSGRVPCIYDASTQKYWLFTIEGALLLHETPRVVIPKKTARQLMYRMHNANEALVHLLNMPASSSGLITDSVILHHAIHDSITVKRSSSSSRFFKFWEDKSVRPTAGIVNLSSRYLLHLRPSFNDLASHKCATLYHCGNNVIYCSTCTAYRLPTAVSNGSIETGPPLLIGRLILPADIAQSIYGRCLQPGSKQLDFNHAYRLLSECFHQPTITSIDIPPAWMVANMLRDSLFISRGYGYPSRGQNWINYFNITDQQMVSVSSISSSSNNVSTGVAVVGTGASVGLNVASILLNP
ncbi:hypothetical protein BDW59DRAFT_176654 [Aspergillus cavernicola]|uniref:Uncharacterized protein n=1 Tax=Aspergillus cavernicola TaxID=176166 RepID=A0ABR4HF48_9EURO